MSIKGKCQPSEFFCDEKIQGNLDISKSLLWKRINDSFAEEGEIIKQRVDYTKSTVLIKADFSSKI